MSTIEPTTTGPAAQAGGLPRRRVLQVGAALLPGLIGSRLLGDAMTAATAAPQPPAGASDTNAAPATNAAPPAAYDPSAHRWAFACDTTTCLGCGHCVIACKAENGVPTDAEHTRTWIELHIVGEDGVVRFDSPDAGINGFTPQEADALAAGVPISQAYFVPRLCMQCENPPCVNVCPVSATYRNADGVVLVDEQRCLGCGYCMAACPYGARYIVPNGSQAPKGVAGVVDKCTFCYHRITKGLQPACVEACPVEARVFGDLNDPASPVNKVLRSSRTQVMKPTLGTRPRVHYVGLESEVG
jgi:tetrathionate reductase subunit B